MSNKRTFTGILGAVGAAALSLPGVCGAAGDPGPGGDLGGYRFRYRVGGQGDAAPVQVFDDGRNTYFQFASVNRALQIVAFDDARTPSLPTTRIQSPYVVVDGMAARYAITSGTPGTMQHAVVDATGPVNVALVNRGAASAPFTSATAAAAREADAHAELLRVAREVYGRALAQRDAEAVRYVQAAIDLLEKRIPDRFEGGDTASPAQSSARAPRDIDRVALPERRAASVPRQPLHPAPAEAMPKASPASFAKERYPVVAALAHTGMLHSMSGTPTYGAGGGAVKASPEALVEASRQPQQRPIGAAVPSERVASAEPEPRTMDTRATGRPDTSGTPSTTPSALVFSAGPGQRVSEALRAFLSGQGWQMEWETDSDFQIRRGYEIRGASVEDILVGVLGDYQLSAVVYRGNRVVAIASHEPGHR